MTTPTDTTSSTAMMTRLGIIAKEDIEFFTQMREGLDKESALYSLIDSLIDVKRNILKLVTTDDGQLLDTTSPMSPKGGIDQYDQISSVKDQDAFTIAKAIHQVEVCQLNFVKKMAGSKGIPEKLQDRVDQILTIYTRTEEQLNRSVKTTNLSALQF